MFHRVYSVVGRRPVQKRLRGWAFCAVPDMKDADDTFGFVFLRFNDVEQHAAAVAAPPPRRTVVEEAANLNIIKIILGGDGMGARQGRKCLHGKQ